MKGDFERVSGRKSWVGVFIRGPPMFTRNWREFVGVRRVRRRRMVGIVFMGL